MKYALVTGGSRGIGRASGNGIGLRTVEDRVKCIDGVYSLTSDAKGTSFIVETGI